eukprot:178594_1
MTDSIVTDNENKYDKDILSQLMILGVADEDEIKYAMDNVINKFDINEITRFIHKTQENVFHDKVLEVKDGRDTDGNNKALKRFELTAFTDECKSVKECSSIQRIKAVLIFYQQLNSNNNDY